MSGDDKGKLVLACLVLLEALGVAAAVLFVGVLWRMRVPTEDKVFLLVVVLLMLLGYLAAGLIRSRR